MKVVLGGQISLGNFVRGDIILRGTIKTVTTAWKKEQESWIAEKMSLLALAVILGEIGLISFKKHEFTC